MRTNLHRVVARDCVDLHLRRGQAREFVGKWPERRRLSARIAANDVTGLTDSLRGGLHIERVGRQHGANSLAISIHSRILAHRNERTYREDVRERASKRKREKERGEGGKGREGMRESERTDTD